MPTKTLRIPTTDGQADACAAFPDHSERHPGVLMYADGFGIRPCCGRWPANWLGTAATCSSPTPSTGPPAGPCPQRPRWS